MLESLFSLQKSDILDRVTSEMCAESSGHYIFACALMTKLRFVLERRTITKVVHLFNRKKDKNKNKKNDNNNVSISLAHFIVNNKSSVLIGY